MINDSNMSFVYCNNNVTINDDKWHLFLIKNNNIYKNTL